MYFTIGEMAKKLNVASSTLRYYDKEGLLPFVERSDGGIRVFKDEDMEWLTIIECLKQAGLSIKDIKVFIDWCMEGDSTISERRKMIMAQREAVEEQIAQKQKTLNLLKYKSWYYETAEKAGTTEGIDKIAPEKLPPEIRKLREEIRESVKRF